MARSHRDFVRFSLALPSSIRRHGGPLHGCGLVRKRRPEHSLAGCPRSRRPRGCGLVWSRSPDQLLASCPRSRGLRGCGLVRGSLPWPTSCELFEEPSSPWLWSGPGSLPWSTSCELSEGPTSPWLWSGLEPWSAWLRSGLEPKSPWLRSGLEPRSAWLRSVWSRSLRGCGLVGFRYPDQLLACCPGGRGLRGYDLVRSRRPEHGVEHAEQLPGHRHDGPLLTAAMPQPSEQGSPFRTLADQTPGCLHQGPPQQSPALLGNLQVLGLLLPALRPPGTVPA